MPTSNSHACPRIGVLALQGTFSLHRQTLERLGVASREIREKADLASLDGLILPGGESSTMLKLMVEEDLFQPLVRFHRSGGALYGTCAGAILLAAEVENPNQESLGLLDIRIRRNAYGRQAESHVGELPCPALGEPALPLVMIRGPAITRIGPEVQVLAHWRGQPAFVKQGRVLASTFHPELTEDTRIHRLFVNEAARGEAAEA